jgi:hypothetical protein
LPKELPFKPLEAKGHLQKKGIKHERQVAEYLTELYELSYFAGMWFAYGDGSSGTRYCQLDGLLADHKRRNLVVVECKLRHTPEAYWQTENLYLPVVRAWLTDQRFWSLSVCEIVRWCDPHTSFPTQCNFIENLDLVREDRFNVHILPKHW